MAKNSYLSLEFVTGERGLTGGSVADSRDFDIDHSIKVCLLHQDKLFRQVASPGYQNLQRWVGDVFLN